MNRKSKKFKKSKNKIVEKAFKCKYCNKTRTGHKAITDHEIGCKMRHTQDVLQGAIKDHRIGQVHGALAQ